ncbi:hypothetical protein WA158_005721 [Blastocystis sp. Blastoise]
MITFFSLLLLSLLIGLIIVPNRISKYKANIQRIDEVIKDDMERKQRDITYHYNPLIADIKLKLSEEKNEYDVSIEASLESDQRDIIQELEKTELYLKYQIELYKSNHKSLE